MERDWCSYAWYVDTLMRNRDEFTVVNRSRAFPQVEAEEDVRHILTPRFFPLWPSLGDSQIQSRQMRSLKKNCCKTAKDEEECCKKFGSEQPESLSSALRAPLFGNSHAKTPWRRSNPP